MILFPGRSAMAIARNPLVWGAPAQAGDTVVMRVTGVPSNSGLSAKFGNVLALAQGIQPVENNAGVSDVMVTLPPGVPVGDAVPVSIQLVQPSGQILESNVVTMAIEEIRQ